MTPGCELVPDSHDGRRRGGDRRRRRRRRSRSTGSREAGPAGRRRRRCARRSSGLSEADAARRCWSRTARSTSACGRAIVTTIPTLERRVTLVVAGPGRRRRRSADAGAGADGRRPTPSPPTGSPGRRESGRAGTIRLMLPDPPRTTARRRTPRRAASPAAPVTRLLGIDLGRSRIGLAVADAGIGHRAPARDHRPRRDARRRRRARSARVCREQAVTELVVGLPVEAARQRGRRWPPPRASGPRRIGERLALPVTLRDERLSARSRRSAGSGRDAPRPVGRPAVADPAQRVPGANRSRGRKRHPAGRARRAPRGRPPPEPRP